VNKEGEVLETAGHTLGLCMKQLGGLCAASCGRDVLLLKLPLLLLIIIIFPLLFLHHRCRRSTHSVALLVALEKTIHASILTATGTTMCATQVGRLQNQCPRGVRKVVLLG